MLQRVFKVANVDIPIMSIDFLRHFGFGVDVSNNRFILPYNSIYRRHNTSHIQRQITQIVFPLQKRAMLTTCLSFCFARITSLSSFRPSVWFP